MRPCTTSDGGRGAPAGGAEPELYLDYAATTPLLPEAAEAMAEAARAAWGNPSSVHAAGRRARAAVEQARAAVAALLGGEPHRWVFTSGGTEANNLAVLGVARLAGRRGRRHLVVSAVEHHSVLDAVAALERDGWAVTRLAPDRRGVVAADAVAAALRPDTALCSLMLANNEVGALQPVAAAARACRARGVLLHTDAVAAAGRLAVDVAALGADLVSVSAHKLYGPKGVGALYVGPGVELEPLLHGGGQERRWRPGTENVPGIVGFGVAARAAARALPAEGPRLAALAEELTRMVLEADLGAVATGPDAPAERVPGLASFAFPGLDGEALLVHLDLQGVRASSGAACTAGSVLPSHVLTAMGWGPEAASAALRLSLGRQTTGEHLRRVVRALGVAVERQRAAARAR